MKTNKSIKKMMALILAGAMVVATGAVFADALKTPADIVSQLTGKSVETLQNQRAQGKTYGTLAKDAGKLAEFKTEMLIQKKAILDQRVKDGVMTQAQADQIYKALVENQATCDGTGNAKIGQKFGAGFGQGKGHGQGNGQGHGNGNGNGNGFGMMGNASNHTVQ